MTTLFNNSDFTMTVETKSVSSQRNSSQTSKISRPLSHGSTMYRNSKQVFYDALAEILCMLDQTATVISQKRYADGTAEVVVEVWEDEDYVVYQYNIDQNGDYTENEL